MGKVWEKRIFKTEPQMNQGPESLFREIGVAIIEVRGAVENMSPYGMWEVMIRYEAPAEKSEESQG